MTSPVATFTDRSLDNARNTGPLKRRAAASSAALVLMVGIFSVAEPAAATSEVYADSLMGEVRASTPEGAPGATDTPLTLNDAGDHFTGTATDMTYDIPQDATGSLVVESQGDHSLIVGLPDLQVAEGGLNSGSDAVVYGAAGDDVSMAVQTFEEGAQLSTVLDSPASPLTYNYEIAIPQGGSVALTDDGGVAVTDANGDPVGFMSSPWARDQLGATVPTHYTVSGNTVTQVIQHRDEGFHYPVVADPYLWKDLIEYAYWDWIPRSPGGAIGAGWTLRVKPTKWARLNAGSYFVGWLGWRELYGRYKNRGLCCNLDSMKDQWICHQQFVSLRTPFAPTWNLDEWRRDTSYGSTALYQCNPPRGGSYAY